MKKVHSVIKFTQNAWLKPQIYMNTKLGEKQKIILRKTISGWYTMQFLEKLWKIWDNRNNKLVTTESRRNYLVSKPNYHTTKFFTENSLAIEKRKTQILMNKPVYLVRFNNTGSQKNCNVWILVYNQTKIWWKSKTLSYVEILFISLPKLFLFLR